jgi:hypothetical protein
MGTEIEKKYRIEGEAAERLRGRLRAAGAQGRGEEFEENILYAGLRAAIACCACGAWRGGRSSPSKRA